MTTFFKNLVCATGVTALALWANAASAQLLLNEVSAANLNHHLDGFDKHEDWIEVYNPTSDPITLFNWYISDNENNPTKYQIPEDVYVPANGFAVIICSGRANVINGVVHTSFRLSQTKNTAEHIVLSNPQGVLADSKKLKTVQRDHAYGRKQDGGSDWGVTKVPTPGASNNTVKFYEDYLKKPVMDSLPGFYTGTFAIKVSSPDSNVVIRYTKNGNEPTLTSTLYNGTSIPILTTSVVKAAAFTTDTNYLPSFVEFNTYFINEEHTLPVLSVAGNDVTALANGNQDLRPYATLEVFGLDKTRVARTTGELNSHGQDSWVNDQRSIDWVSRDEMGVNGAINEVLFPGLTDRDEFQRIILRAAGDDNYPGGSDWPNQGPPLAAHMRDAYTQNLAKRGGLHLDTRTGSKAIVYLNGKYWGVYDLREIPDDHDYTEYNYDQGKYEIDFLATWGDTWAEYASTSEAEVKADWNNLVNYIKNNDLSEQAKFEVVKEQLDYKSLVDYMLVNSFANASDWLNYNTSWWRGNNPEGTHQKWGYILWDLDATYAYYINYTGILDTSATAPPCNVEQIDLNDWAQWDPYPQQHLDILNKMQENTEFRQYWITRQADLNKSVFGCENMLSYFDEVLASIEPEMPRHIQKWGGSVAQWKSNVERFRYFVERRCAYFSTGLPDCYDLTGPFKTVLIVEPPLSGSIQANSLIYNGLPDSTEFFGNIGLRLEALPAGNNTFVRWEAKNHTFPNPMAPLTELDMTQPDTIVAYFSGSSVAAPEPKAPQPDVVVFPTLVSNGFAVDYHLPHAARVEITLVDVAGREVNRIQPMSRYEIEGNQRIFVQTQQMAPGTYFVKFITDKGYVESIPVTVIQR